MLSDEAAALHVELLFLHDPPLVKTAATQRFALRLGNRRRAFELDDISHGGCSIATGTKLAHTPGRVYHPFLLRGNPVALDDARYFSLATYRRNGREVATPVWFAAADDTFYVFSAGDAGKVKRIRAGSRARVARCDVRGKLLGDWQDATARLVTDATETRRAYQALRKKYGVSMRVLDFFAQLTGRYHRRQLIAVSLSDAK
jgi:uncharacterized protein